MVRGLPVVLDCGEARLDADRDRAWNCRLPAAVPDEGSARISWALLALGMDRLRRVGRSWDRAACREECKDCCGGLYSERKMNLQTNAKFEMDRALVYTFEGELLSHR